MYCKVCGNRVVQLFMTVACDYCDFGPSAESCQFGFITFDEGAFTSGVYEVYVFRTTLDCERWREASGHQHSKIKKVYSLKPFRWQLSCGTLRDLVLASDMYIVHSDHRFTQKPGEYHCWLASEDSK